MHTELYVDARDLGEIAQTVAALPSVSIDAAEAVGTHLDAVLHEKAAAFHRF